MAYIVQAYPGYQLAPHNEKLVEWLEDVERGDRKRVIVEMPPRHGKSLIVSIHFPAWYLGRNPTRRIIAASYAAELAYTFSRQARNLFEAPSWPFTTRLAPDARGVEHWQTTTRGGYVATGVGGSQTGHGADCLLVDDPVRNREDADSEVIRENQWQWYLSTARTRLQPEGAIVVCQTRWHQADLAGRLLQAAQQGGEKWDLLRLPAIAEQGDVLGRSVGESLWPEWYGTDALDTIRRTIGSRNWSALYQQRPYSEEGARFKRAWFTVVPAAPPGLHWVRYWDLAASTAASGDYTVGAKCAFDAQGTLYIADIARGRWEWPDALAVVQGIAQMDGRGVRIGIEGIGMQRGFVQTLYREPALRGYSLQAIPVLKDKLLRATPWQTRAEAGKVALVLGPWNNRFLDEVTAFPLGEHDDQVDAVSGCCQMLSTSQPPRPVKVTMG